MSADPVALAYVHGNQVACSWHHSIIGLFVHDLQHHRRILRGGTIAIRTNAGQLVPARNKAARYLLEGSVPWLLWLDTDMGFAPDILERLLEVADPVHRPVVGALCFAQQELGSDGMGGYHTAATPTIYDWAPPDADGMEGFEIRRDYPPDAIVECAATGSAAILIHRGVFERVAVKYGQEWYHRLPARGGSMGEDLSFCMRARELDIPIFVHTGVRTTHAKTTWLSEANYRMADQDDLALIGAQP